IDLFLQEGFRVNILTLPEGLDPDSFTRRDGVQAYVGRLEKSARYLDFLLEAAIKSEKGASTPRGKVNVLNELLPYVALRPNRFLNFCGSSFIRIKRSLFCAFKTRLEATKRSNFFPKLFSLLQVILNQTAPMDSIA